MNVLIKVAGARVSPALSTDLARSASLHIAEGAKDDDRCGIGIHASEPDVFDMDRWGRNQLGHACMLVSRYLADEGRGES